MTKVLVIDDEAVVREVIVAMLAGSGYEVVCAATAAEALELFPDESIRVVITDVFMPDGSGLELLETMRIRRPNLPIVLVTGATTRDDLSEDDLTKQKAGCRKEDAGKHKTCRLPPGCLLPSAFCLLLSQNLFRNRISKL